MKGELLFLPREAESPVRLSDEALVASCAAGDPAAFGELFERHHSALYRFISRLTRYSAADLDDLVQTTFVEALRSSASFGRKSQVRTWLFGIAANVIRHHVRSGKRREKLLESYGEQAKSLSCRYAENAAERRLLLARLAAAFESLPHELKVVFALCYLEEVEGPEAAKALGIPKGTLWRRLHHARKALQSAIGEEERP